MKIKLILAGIFSLFLLTNTALAVERYGATLCHRPDVTCHKVRSGETWERLFHTQEQIDLVMRFNRTNMRLYPGMILAIPNGLENQDIISISPFPEKIKATGEKHVIVDLQKLAWGAYDEQGYLVHWGPASGGKGYCPDIGKTCRTVTGNYRIYAKQPAGCVSSVFPIASDGGAPMPFCMHFWRGFALHGSTEVPGYNASHGCVRMFINDARWLNEEFTDIGTKVSIDDY